MTMNTPLGGAGSPCEPASEEFPASAGRIDFPGRIAGFSGRLFGDLGARPAGLALRLDERAPDDCDFEIALVDEHGGTLMVLGRFDEDEVVAVWRELAGTTGFPLLTQSEDGAVQHPFPQVGRVRLGRIRIRRRHGLPNGRRPRFLVRRKTTRLPRRPTVHREREIFSSRV
jgi:Family of unknown function (DUF6101)